MAACQIAGRCAHWALALGIAAGCVAKPPARQAPQLPIHPVSIQPLPPVDKPADGAARQASFEAPAVEAAPAPSEDLPFPPQGELSLPGLLREVEARNPSIQAMAAAWQAMAQRYPQAISLDDPMFMAMAAPASLGTSQVESAYILSGSQKFPWFGKRDVRGQAAQAEASAAFHDLNDARLQIEQVTRIAFYDYYLVTRQSELLEQNSGVMRQFRDSARTKYENLQVTQQDVLQADIELADLERRGIENARMRSVAAARINTLLRRDPGAPLPPPPGTLAIEPELPPIGALQQAAATQRPDLAALDARVRAAEAAVNLALKQYYPDAELFGRYDSFWQPAATQGELRSQVGVNMNVPIYRQKLRAAVCEAQFRLSQRQAEFQQRQLDIQYEVQSAYDQVQESRRVADLYYEKLLPYAQQNVDVATASYDVGRINFLQLALAQRQLIEVQEKRQQALADYHRRLAELTRVTGGSSW